ncbi:MAG: hypothetical protein NUV80_07490 [Candidatus Berkelbacteria bacterium]|nr:hypothetical protein [Candidatus Berkelbacteria bacterium]
MADGPGRPRITGLVDVVERWLQPLADWIQSRVGVVSVTAAYTVPANIFYVRADVTSAGFQVTLPLAAGKDGRQICVKKIDASGNTLTLGITGSDTIEGSATKTTTTQWARWVVISNGNATWEIIG